MITILYSQFVYIKSVIRSASLRRTDHAMEKEKNDNKTKKKIKEETNTEEQKIKDKSIKLKHC
jgi:hypothetical protein